MCAACGQKFGCIHQVTTRPASNTRIDWRIYNTPFPNKFSLFFSLEPELRTGDGRVPRERRWQMPLLTVYIEFCGPGRTLHTHTQKPTPVRSHARCTRHTREPHVPLPRCKVQRRSSSLAAARTSGTPATPGPRHTGRPAGRSAPGSPRAAVYTPPRATRDTSHISSSPSPPHAAM